MTLMPIPPDPHEEAAPVGVRINIITCPQWGAAKPLAPIVPVAQAQRIIFHHTAGHHAEISNPKDESEEEAMRYARDIQRYHMTASPSDPSKPWKDSGHNFLICRNGLILQGRWYTVSAIQEGHMVESAHCPGQNGQVGIEHEHLGSEEMTAAQRESSSMLMAWIAWKYSRQVVLPVDPHSKFFATSCPANLKGDIAGIVTRAQAILTGV
jgi:hypothetical protein